MEGYGVHIGRVGDGYNRTSTGTSFFLFDLSMMHTLHCIVLKLFHKIGAYGSVSPPFRLPIHQIIKKDVKTHGNGSSEAQALGAHWL